MCIMVVTNANVTNSYLLDDGSITSINALCLGDVTISLDQ